MPNFVKITQKSLKGPAGIGILISSLFLFTSLSKSFFIVLFATYSVNVNFRDY